MRNKSDVRQAGLGVPSRNKSAVFTRPILRMGRVYKLKSCLSVCVCVCPSSLQLFTEDSFKSLPMNHRPTKPLSGGCLVVSGTCLVVSDACLEVSCGDNVCRLICPELIDVYGQISLPVHLTDAAKMLILLMQCWC